VVSAEATLARRSGDFVQSLDRGLAVIKAFGPDHSRLTLSDVARTTGLTRAAARRFLLTLVELGYVQSDGRHFSLRPRVLELGYAYLSTLSLTDVASPHLERLVATLGESSSVSVLDGDDIVYVVRMPSKRIMNAVIAVGTRFPAYATSMGRVLLAALPPAELQRYLAGARLEPFTPHTVTDREALVAALDEVRSQGWALVDQELEEGLRSVAAPIADDRGRATAAINVSTHVSRVGLDTLRAVYLPELLAAAEGIRADLLAAGSQL
jgi:IclR family pca regulon transcriptional regulator